MNRISRDDAGMMTALLWALRSTCCYFKVGCVIDSGTVISVGYNGGPKGKTNCIDSSCRKTDGGSCIALHAEDNAIAHAKGDPRLAGATMYVTVQPCVSCSSKILQAGIARVIAARSYERLSLGHDGRQDESQQAYEWLNESGIRFDWYQPQHPFAERMVSAYLAEIDAELALYQTDEP